jgi:predicted HD phosphohydrolase
MRSVETLASQGDALAGADLTALGNDPDLAAILDLRRADERAKDPNARVPGLETWSALLESLAR